MADATRAHPATADPQLPPESRIYSRVDGDRLIITVPRSRSRQHGFIGSWGATALFAFLAITFIAQGLLTKNSSWTAGGFLFLLLTAFQLPMLLRSRSKTVFEITADDLTEINGPDDAPRRRIWPRVSAAEIRSLPPISLLSSLNPAEIDWISDQIHRKWETSEKRAQGSSALKNQ